MGLRRFMLSFWMKRWAAGSSRFFRQNRVGPTDIFCRPAFEESGFLVLFQQRYKRFFNRLFICAHNTSGNIPNYYLAYFTRLEHIVVRYNRNQFVFSTKYTAEKCGSVNAITIFVGVCKCIRSSCTRLPHESTIICCGNRNNEPANRYSFAHDLHCKVNGGVCSQRHGTL
jgi:hypothetical protein